MKIKKSNFAYFYFHLLAFAFTDSAGSAEPTVAGDDLANKPRRSPASLIDKSGR